MDSDDFRFWGVIITVLAVACTIAVSVRWISCRHVENTSRTRREHVENMARLGYEETPIPGTSSRVWRKAVEPPASDRITTK